MAYIYVITNNLNGKQYVGKTQLSVEERFDQHKKDARRTKNQHRPLYAAFKKYGVDNFSYSMLEECSSEDASEREQYWIATLNTYGSSGYNATVGGDAKAFLDHQLIIDTYQKERSYTKTAQKCGCCIDSVKNICKSNGIKSVPFAEVISDCLGKKVVMMPENMEFESISEAARYITKEDQKYSRSKQKDIVTHICQVCQGKRKTAYGHTWVYSIGT